ncbi:Asp23/Gls24 family envelope stress response protein [Kineococcus aurantiacus]|uniref:Putative alkaline shock family protein YloU n=1 Tax=Kineococcus aurantiacus TaxID=37633 RepID=A0A7Y9DJQ8_9ACTN|nr:Asp23/Gls24 family envelope stress response protein [Kineococcus aurantiacus]NYD21597.1 putative alkaline shock family protein YloU [Kineococcus aurantiacus]
MAEAAVLPDAPAADPGTRGRLVVTDRAVVQIARAAAGSVSGSVRADRSRVTLGAAVDSALDTVRQRTYPTAECTRAGNRVRVSVQVAARWPVPAPDLAARVRSGVVEELSRLAGVVVDACDVTVAEYVHARPERGRVR